MIVVNALIKNNVKINLKKIHLYFHYLINNDKIPKNITLFTFKCNNKVIFLYIYIFLNLNKHCPLNNKEKESKEGLYKRTCGFRSRMLFQATSSRTSSSRGKKSLKKQKQQTTRTTQWGPKTPVSQSRSRAFNQQTLNQWDFRSWLLQPISGCAGMLRGQRSLFWLRPLPQDYGRDSNSNCEWEPVLKRGQAHKLWQKIQNPRCEPTQTFHDHILDTFGHQDDRLKGKFNREFKANKRSKKRTLKVGRIFFPPTTRKRRAYFLSAVFSFSDDANPTFFAQNKKKITQKFDKAVKKCFRLNLVNSLDTYLQRTCLIWRSEICAELCLALSVFTITHNGNRAASGKMAATSITPLSPRMHLN